MKLGKRIARLEVERAARSAPESLITDADRRRLGALGQRILDDPDTDPKEHTLFSEMLSRRRPTPGEKPRRGAPPSAAHAYMSNRGRPP